MSSGSLELGDAFLFDTPPNGMHLFIAIAPIATDKFLFVNTTSPKENSDTSCIIKPGLDVPKFIIHESVIAYKYAREININKLFELIDIGSCKPKGFCSPSILLDIQQGAIKSKQIPKKYKNAVKIHLGIL